MTRELFRMPTSDPSAMLRALRDALTGDGPAVLPKVPGTRQPGGAGGSDNLPSAQAEPARVDAPDLATVPAAVALVIETSGSTGSPKRVALSRDALLASAAASASALGAQGQWLLALPVHYVAGAQVLIRSIVAGTEPLALAPGHFDPRAFAELARELTGDARFVSLVPVQLARLLDAAREDRDILAVVRRFDGILLGGQRPPTELLERADENGLMVRVTYGSSETCGGCVYDGVPIGNTQARLVDGELQLSGAVLADGYLGDQERTASSFVADGGLRWYRTGDFGRIEDDRVFVDGRLDSVIISGGEKVALDAVERVVRELPGFADAVVVARPSEEWGQVPVVAVADPPDIKLAELRRSVSAHLGKAAAPADVIVVGPIPMLASGKPDRVAVARAAQRSERQ